MLRVGRLIATQTAVLLALSTIHLATASGGVQTTPLDKSNPCKLAAAPHSLLCSGQSDAGAPTSLDPAATQPHPPDEFGLLAAADVSRYGATANEAGKLTADTPGPLISTAHSSSEPSLLTWGDQTEDDFNRKIYYKNKIELSLSEGWLWYNTPLVLARIIHKVWF
jgi:hypothetical protein